ncbi:MAG: ATP-binding cassette domain-containing protein [Marinobacterium sp.]|nr:ATP-binding cassette domain-containing protein [Marinobacterium sp.]
MPDTPCALEVNQLVITRDNRPLHYQLHIHAGEIVAIQGRSGVGKSTLLSAIAGFVTPQQGEILWQGQLLLALPANQRPVAMLFQDHNLFEHLSVKTNLQLGFDGPAPMQALAEGCAALQVSELLHKTPAQLSGGQRQRVAIIRTLLRPEPLILLDEPFAELDPATRQQAVNWVGNTARATGKTLLLVTHQQDDVTQLADRALMLG